MRTFLFFIGSELALRVPSALTGSAISKSTGLSVNELQAKDTEWSISTVCRASLVGGYSLKQAIPSQKTTFPIKLSKIIKY